MFYSNVREEELKNKVAQDYFGAFDCTKIIGNIDFCVTLLLKEHLFDTQSLLWAEAKQGNKADIYESFVQLILTIGKARTFDTHLPPAFLGAFDAEKIAFVPYNDVQDIFYQNDFNWKVAPSNYDSKEFKQVYEKVKHIIENQSMLFAFGRDDDELRAFIQSNFVEDKATTSKIKIDKNNFTVIYSKWLAAVKPTILINWEVAQKNGVIDGDFYLADLLSRDNETLKEKLYILLKSDRYEIDRKLDEMGLFVTKTATFNDRQKAHQAFWNKYERPPKEEYWDYIVERRDLLVPQDVRERKGSFFTPQKWVELSQQYIADLFGEDWQDEYYVWDCAAGTGNLLTGLTNKYRIWASTLDKQDVDVIKDRIKNGANLLEEHVFQFDFLNDVFGKLPHSLQQIINNPEKRKKLIIYINPPYAEIAGNKVGVNLTAIHDKYATQLEVANRELFAQFLIRIYNEIQGCKIAEFSKLKTLSGANFQTFRQHFLAKLACCFVVPANTFDNVKGRFPIGFKIWDTAIKQSFEQIQADVYDRNGIKLGKHNIYSYADSLYFSKWITSFKTTHGQYLGWLEGVTRNDFQAQQGICILNKKEQIAVPRGIAIYAQNLLIATTCFAVRKVIDANWLNDRDQFLYPNESWANDHLFQTDCFAYTLFNNNIQAKLGVNHWIPFTEAEVDARDNFDSNFMTDFMRGKFKQDALDELFGSRKISPPPTALMFSETAKVVFEAGRKLWQYYHAQDNCDVNASLYDIRAYFQGFNPQGKMNNKSNDAHYLTLIEALREALKNLAKAIEPKIYEHGFLKN
ncbi:MAG TPA: hypothetical protein PK230_04270 [Chitinophagales bacterium]|nr:hypothetical protein [Chitinophagales bacterium]